MNGARIKLVPLAEVFPESALADAIDQDIQRGLPAVPGLDEAHTAEERAAVFARAIETQRAEFVSLYGEAFGWERRSEPRDEVSVASVSVTKRLALAE